MATTHPIPDWLVISAGSVVLALLAGLGLAVLWAIFTERIDLSRLISEPNGDASMSRFQLLIFTFVVAASLFLVIICKCEFPQQIPQGVLLLLGISGSSYLVSKGIQFSDPEGVRERLPEVNITPGSVELISGGARFQFSAKTERLRTNKVKWSSTPANLGTIGEDTGLYTPPPIPPAPEVRPTGVVTIIATSVDDEGVSGEATVTLR